MKTCEETTELMSLYIDNELTVELLKDFEEHINNCDKCKNDLANLKEVILLVNNLEEVELPQNYHEELILKLNNEKNYKYKGIKKYSLVSCMFLIFISLLWYNGNITSSNEDNSDFFANSLGGHSHLESNMTRKFILEENLDLNISSMTDFISYNIHLQVEDIQEAYYIINNFPGNVISTNLNNSYDSIGYFIKKVNINDYEHIKYLLSNMGNIIFEEESGITENLSNDIINDSDSNLTELLSKDISAYIYIILEEFN